MTVDEEIQEFLKHYEGYDLPSPEHEPIQFGHYVKMFRFYKERTNNEKEV